MNVVVFHQVHGRDGGSPSDRSIGPRLSTSAAVIWPPAHQGRECLFASPSRDRQPAAGDQVPVAAVGIRMPVQVTVVLHLAPRGEIVVQVQLACEPGLRIEAAFNRLPMEPDILRLVDPREL
jgi:hypothetical protein